MNPKEEDITGLQNNFDDFFENALCGYLIASANGEIIRVNEVLSNWMGMPVAALLGKPFSNLLSIGGKIYYETHLGPLLRMQGYFDEVALELLSATQQKLPVLVNAMERRDSDGKILFSRLTVFKASDRRIYEQNLKHTNASLEISFANAQQVTRLREQFIAILGHDLRNPLGAIVAGASMLAQSHLEETDLKIVGIISRGASRMAEMISNIMDFARTRLGQGIIINAKPTEIEPTLVEVVDELRSAWPTRVIRTNFQVDEPVTCDAPRIAQIVSNLVANAITHGFADTPIDVNAISGDKKFTIEVCNMGHPISPGLIHRLFEPFSRESHRPSQNGLGLGLYIASEISKAHNGEITATSTPEKTCFTFRMGGSN